MYEPNIDWYMPAIEFEAQTGLRGVAQEYAMPDGLTMRQMAYNYIVSGYETGAENILKVLDKIITLNPDLADITFQRQNPAEVRDVLSGVLSGFKPCDIQYYIDTQYERLSDELTGIINTPCDRFALKKYYERSLGMEFNWMVSPESFDVLKAQLEIDAPTLPHQRTLQKIRNECGL